MRPSNFPCSQKGYKPKPCSEVPHILISPSAGHTNRSPSSPEGALVGFRVAILLKQLSPSGSGVCYIQPPCSGSGKHAVLHWVMVASREIYVPKRVASPHILQRSRRSSSLITDHMASALHTRPLLFMVDFLPYTL